MLAITASPAPDTSYTSAPAWAGGRFGLHGKGSCPLRCGCSRRLNPGGGARLAVFRLALARFRAAHHFFQFGAIGCEQSGAGIFVGTVALGVHQHGLAGFSRAQSISSADMGEAAFAVVGQQHHIDWVASGGIAFSRHREFRGAAALRNRGGLIAHCAPPRAISRWWRYRHRAADGGYAVCCIRLSSAAAASSVAHHQNKPMATQSGDIARHVGRTAGALVDTADFRHRHRRFGRNADTSPQTNNDPASHRPPPTRGLGGKAVFQLFVVNMKHHRLLHPHDLIFQTGLFSDDLPAKPAHSLRATPPAGRRLA